MGEGAQVVDVLELKQYREAHLPGAEHIRLHQIVKRASEELEANRPVIVYCWDSA